MTDPAGGDSGMEASPQESGASGLPRRVEDVERLLGPVKPLLQHPWFSGAVVLVLGVLLGWKVTDLSGELSSVDARTKVAVERVEQVERRLRDLTKDSVELQRHVAAAKVTVDEAGLAARKASDLVARAQEVATSAEGTANAARVAVEQSAATVKTLVAEAEMAAAESRAVLLVLEERARELKGHVDRLQGVMDEASKMEAVAAVPRVAPGPPYSVSIGGRFNGVTLRGGIPGVNSQSVTGDNGSALVIVPKDRPTTVSVHGDNNVIFVPRDLADLVQVVTTGRFNRVKYY